MTSEKSRKSLVLKIQDCMVLFFFFFFFLCLKNVWFLSRKSLISSSNCWVFFPDKLGSLEFVYQLVLRKVSSDSTCHNFFSVGTDWSCFVLNFYYFSQAMVTLARGFVLTKSLNTNPSTVDTYQTWWINSWKDHFA